MNRPALTLVQLRKRIFELYDQKQWQEALSLIDEHSQRLSRPSDIARLVYWKACFLSLMGMYEQALESLQEGLRAGLWWSEMRLRQDDDLRGLQGRPAFEAIVTECIARQQQAQNLNQETVKLVSQPRSGSLYPLILVLHGYGSNAEETLPDWSQLTERGWLVAALQSSQLADIGTFHWADEEQAAQDVETNLDELKKNYALDLNRLAIGGFSNGGRTALMLALTGKIRARWVISVGGSLRDETLDSLDWTLIGSFGELHVLLIVGDHDEPSFGRMTAQCDLLKTRGLDVTLQVVPGMGHTVPSDLTARVTDWLP